ncbi:MAG: cytidine deaminase [candidate division WOR-3 bacterium]|nr:cytidine deaminase [candidate division WOR-3 bacterium]MDH5684097.1 cytidine deaminase [candidate division WOR-3 bacterium]
MSKQQKIKLLEAAKKASRFAYAPYSRFRVGAAVLTKSGKIFTGCNVENASYGLTVCAERIAIFKAIAEAERYFDAIAIYTNTKDFTLPCGACLQVLAEFSENLRVIIINRYRKIKEYRLSELMPYPFK